MGRQEVLAPRVARTAKSGRSSRKTKVWIGVIVVALALGYLGYSAFRTMTGLYYMTITELEAYTPKVPNEMVRVGGPVVPGTIQYSNKDGRISFKISDEKAPGKALSVSSKGEVPDSFRPGITVILVGTYNPEQRFLDSVVLLTKCPHSYIPG